MNLVQKVHGDNKTSAELSDAIFMLALLTGTESSRIDVVFDVDLDESVKNAERVNRGSDSGILFSDIVAGHKVKQRRRLLSSSKSKSNLIKFLAQDWQKQSLRARLLNKVMYVNCERKCFRLTEDTWSEIESLYSTQEEADTRMLLHAKHAEEQSTAAIIASQDTDVFIMSLSFAHEFACQFYVKSGTQTRETC